MYKRLDKRRQQYSERRFGDILIDMKRPAPTITKIGRLFWDRDHEIGIKSYASIMSFPQSFKWCGKHVLVRERIGNSVPPKMMQAIAECVKEVLEGDM